MIKDYEVSDYIAYVKKRTERDRISDKKVTGVFSGSYAINPFTDEKIHSDNRWVGCSGSR